MPDLAWWLRRELERRTMSQNAAAVHCGVAVATVSAILNKGHVPKVETLFRLADFFQTPRDYVLRLAGHQIPEPEKAQVPAAHRADCLERELLDEFRRLPEELKETALQHVAVLIRLAQRPPFRIIGDDEEETPGEEQNGDDAVPHAA